MVGRNADPERGGGPSVCVGGGWNPRLSGQDVRFLCFDGPDRCRCPGGGIGIEGRTGFPEQSAFEPEKEEGQEFLLLTAVNTVKL